MRKFISAFALRQITPGLKSVPLTFYFGDAEAGRASLTPISGDPVHFSAEFLPERIGRYRAVAKFPYGTTQETRFIVFTENLEETEVATDGDFASGACAESSGGKLIEPAELTRLIQELNSEKGRRHAADAPRARVESGLGILPGRDTVGLGLVLAANVGAMLNVKQNILGRLKAADREHQKETGGRFLLRSVKYLCGFVLAAFVLDVVWHLNPGPAFGAADFAARNRRCAFGRRMVFCLHSQKSSRTRRPLFGDARSLAQFAGSSICFN